MGEEENEFSTGSAGEVFVSYSWDSQEHVRRVLALSDRLRSEGVDCVLDQYEESPPEGWPRWMDRKIRDARLALMVCTETYYKRVMGDEVSDQGQGVKSGTDHEVAGYIDVSRVDEADARDVYVGVIAG